MQYLMLMFMRKRLLPIRTPSASAGPGPSLALRVLIALRQIHGHQELGIGADLGELRAQQLDRLHDVHVG